MARQFIIFDTETTGLRRATGDLSSPSGLQSRGDEVCQIGGIIAGEDMKPIRTFCYYCDTIAANSSKGAYEVHGIDSKDIRSHVRCQFLEVVLLHYLQEFFQPDTVFVGWNIEFDMSMVRQTISNAPASFDWKPFKGQIVPKSGRWSVDAMSFFPAGKTYRKLATFATELAYYRHEFFYENSRLNISTNCMEMLKPSCLKAHNSFFDALDTFLLWRDRIWQQKLI